MFSKTLKSNLLIMFLAMINSILVAQNAHPDEVFGTVSKEHLAMTNYPLDTSANALYLLDKAVLKSLVDLNTDHVFLVSYTVHRRLKIFNTKALDEGNIAIHYYAERRVNTLKKLEILVHYPDGTTKQVPTTDSYDEDLGDGFFMKKVFIPGLQQGVVIEYQYKIEIKERILSNTWNLQSDIPRLKSVTEIQLSRNLEYDFVIVGMDRATENTVSDDKSYYYTRRLVLENVPAIKYEPHCRSVPYSRIEFHFKSVVWSGRSKTRQASWEALATDMKLAGFEKEYIQSSKTNKLLERFEKVYDPQADKLKTLKMTQEFVVNNIKWNGLYQAEDGLNEALSKKVGSYNNLSFALLACLRKAEIDAYPVMVRLRRKGACLTNYVDEEQFQAVAVLVKLNGEEFLMDASSPYYQPGEVDEQILNSIGWIPDSDTTRWVDIVPSEVKDITQINLKLDEQGHLTGKVQLNFTGWLAREARENMAKKNYLDIAKDYFLDTHDNLSLTDFNCDTSFVKGKPLKMDFNVDFGQVGMVANDMIYLPALPCSYFESNPFKAQTRTYPISFPNPIRSQVVISYSLPEGYVVEELPKSTLMNFENDGILLNYSITSPSPSTVQISYKMQLKTLEYKVEAYETLKQFFDAMISRINDQIVLRKKS